MRIYLRNGCLAGLAGGLAAVLFMLSVGRGPINDAIALEDSQAATTEGEHDHETASRGGGDVHEDLFTRGVQEVGGAIGLLLFGLGVGVVFSVVLAASARRLAASTAFGASLRLGALGFWSVVVVPFLKLPANPPAVGDPDTINQRTILYFAVVAASIALTVFVAQLIARSPRGPVATGWLASGAYAAGLVVIFAVMPGNPDDIAAPAELIWRFRLASLGVLAALWTVLTLTMATLMERAAQADLPSLPADAVGRRP